MLSNTNYLSRSDGGLAMLGFSWLWFRDMEWTSVQIGRRADMTVLSDGDSELFIDGKLLPAVRGDSRR